MSSLIRGIAVLKTNAFEKMSIPSGTAGVLLDYNPSERLFTVWFPNKKQLSFSMPLEEFLKECEVELEIGEEYEVC